MKTAELAAPGDAQSGAQANAPEKVPVVAVIGNPNTGKSSLFNALTGLRQKVANYPGVTVERHTGELFLDGGQVRLVDLPGTYSLAAHSPDEMVTVDVLLGRIADLGHPDAILAVVDASNLRRNLFLVSQAMELDLPMVIALNMDDMAQGMGIGIDVPLLEQRLGVPVIPTVASRGKGMDRLQAELRKSLAAAEAPAFRLLPELKQAAEALSAELRVAGPNPAYLTERALVDEGGYAEQRLMERHGEPARSALERVRKHNSDGRSLAAMEAHARYAWIGTVLDGVLTHTPMPKRWSERIDSLFAHPLWGSLLFLFIMATVFQAVFLWAAPLMGWIDSASGALTSVVQRYLPDGALASLLGDGVIAGVGSVLIFLPQILILSAFIILLEDSGYLARAAFLMDRVMRWCGLSGQSFIPMLSSFACAVPGIMATRVISDPRDRIATIIAAPFMTCSARLPVYALLIAAFVPRQTYLHGWVNLQGLVLLALYLLGIFGGVLTAFLLKHTLLRGPTPSFLMELPPYRWPNPRSVLLRLLDRGKAFVVRAGTVIFTIAVVAWALAYFPKSAELDAEYAERIAQVGQSATGEPRDALLAGLQNELASAHLEQSYIGRMGHAVAPLFSPLGWDWKVTSAVIASFPAREVAVAVLGTLYAVGAEVEAEDKRLITRIRGATWPDGRGVFTIGVTLGLMVFYAFCLQCAATVATIRRETNSWRWPLLAWVYMTTLGYLGAFVCVQVFS